MNIEISTDALTDTNSKLFRSGALYGIKRLEQLGHELFFSTDGLSQLQLELLDNEQISANNSSPESVDLKIISGNHSLKAVGTEGNILETADDWVFLSEKVCFPSRKSFLQRKTAETDIYIELNLDGTGQSDISTGLGFFDHMLEQIAKHGLIDLEISCDGDLDVDEHHTIEDVAIALGEAVNKALGDKLGIRRYGFILPMDESLATIGMDFSGRPYFVFKGEFKRGKVGEFPTEMVEHFFYSLAMNLRATLHITIEGKNDHHKIEACFKGLARCLRSAISRSERNADILPSTKNLL